MGKLENKTAIITGAASGMGKEMALLFASEGAKVVVADLKQEAIDEVVKAIHEAGGKAIGVVCNVAKEDDIKVMFTTTQEKFETLDVLVNNAGVMDNFEPVHEVSDDQWQRIMSINLNGPFYACRLAVPIMLNQGSGSIINVASIGGLNGSRAGLAYTTSKHALIGMSKNIGFMYAQKGIRCNAIAPGGVNTNIAQSMGKPSEFGSSRAMIGGNSMPRMGEAIEIAKTALFLACDDSSFVNGSVVTADGGWTAY
jgi:NAD(P)-dependent dehydrogenase (short-subunit alcohol dehydrogenase family)